MGNQLRYAGVAPCAQTQEPGMITAARRQFRFFDCLRGRADDPGVRDYLAFLKKYTPAADQESDASSAAGYTAAQVMIEVLKRCGDTLTSANVMNVVTTMKDWSFPLFLPGIAINTSPDNHFPMHTTQLKRYDGTRWQLVGKPISE